MRKVFCVLAFVSSVFAWWEVGHMMTAQVAELHLQQINPQALAWANSLIDDFAPLTDGRSNTFVEAAVWADDIKESGTNYLDNWHFTDRPINQKGLMIQLDPITISYNSIDAVKRARSVLTNTKNIHLDHTWAKAQMVRYLLHVIGDMHQPLHNSNFFNESHTKGDLGGNQVFVYVKLQIYPKKLDGTKVNLHAYWDSGASVLQPNDDLLVRPLNESAFNYTQDWCNKAMSKYPLSFFSGKNMSDPVVWTSEGFQDAVNYVYPFFQNTSQITEEYQAQAYSIVERNIVLGGYRLATYLNEIYTSIQVTKAQTSFLQSKLYKGE